MRSDGDVSQVAPCGAHQGHPRCRRHDTEFVERHRSSSLQCSTKIGVRMGVLLYVGCQDWIQSGSTVHDDLTSGDGVASASVARAAEAGRPGNGALPHKSPTSCRLLGLTPRRLTPKRSSCG